MGSFVEALVWRLHQQETRHPSSSKKRPTTNFDKQLSIVHGRSMCAHCHHQLAAQDLVPLFSWLWLRGKCRYCQGPIGRQAPLIELATAALFVVSYVAWPLGLSMVGLVQLIFWLVFIVGFVALIVYDYRWMLLPNKIVFSLTLLAILQTLIVAGLQHRFSVVIGAALGCAVLGGLFLGLFQVSGGKWIGGGDVKLGAMLGILLASPTLSLLVLFLASTSGSVVSVPLLLSGRVKRSTRIPFGPLLLLAAIATQLVGRSIIHWYQRALMV